MELLREKNVKIHEKNKTSRLFWKMFKIHDLYQSETKDYSDLR